MEPQPPVAPCGWRGTPAYLAEAWRTARLRRSPLISTSLNSSTPIVNQKTLDTSTAPTPGLPFCQGGGDPPTPQAARPSGRISRAAVGWERSRAPGLHRRTGRRVPSSTCGRRGGPAQPWPCACPGASRQDGGKPPPRMRARSGLLCRCTVAAGVRVPHPGGRCHRKNEY